MKTIKDLDKLISDSIDSYNKNEYKIKEIGRNYSYELEKENSKLRKKAAFYNDMRLYLLHNPTEESLNNQLNKNKHDLSIANDRLNESIESINNVMTISDFEKEKLIQQAKTNHEHYYSIRKLKKQIANLKFLLS